MLNDEKIIFKKIEYSEIHRNPGHGSDGSYNVVKIRNFNILDFNMEDAKKAYGRKFDLKLNNGPTLIGCVLSKPSGILEGTFKDTMF